LPANKRCFACPATPRIQTLLAISAEKPRQKGSMRGKGSNSVAYDIHNIEREG